MKNLALLSTLLLFAIAISEARADGDCQHFNMVSYKWLTYGVVPMGQPLPISTEYRMTESTVYQELGCSGVEVSTMGDLRTVKYPSDWQGFILIIWQKGIMRGISQVGLAP